MESAIPVREISMQLQPKVYHNNRTERSPVLRLPYVQRRPRGYGEVPGKALKSEVHVQ